MSQNYKVRVSGFFMGPTRNKSSSTCNMFSINLKVTSNYVPDDNSQEKSLFGPKIRDSFTDKTFVFPIHSLLSDDGTESCDFVSKMISEENVPFTLDKLQWRSSPKDEWTSLGNQDDIISQILILARCKASEISNAKDQPKGLAFSVSIMKEVVVPKLEFDAMVDARKREEAVQKIVEALSWINLQPIPDRFRYLLMIRETPEYISYRSSVEQATSESTSKTIPASKSSIEALEQVVFDGDNTNSLCTICMDDLVLGSQVTRLPCIHKFHQTCIVTWLHKSHMCPLCRSGLQTN